MLPCTCESAYPDQIPKLLYPIAFCVMILNQPQIRLEEYSIAIVKRRHVDYL